jgi:hypothetical protein
VVTVRSAGVGTQAKKEYFVAGVLATGSGAKRSSSTSSVGQAPLAEVFLPLAGCLGLLFMAPYFVRLRSGTPAEEPATAKRQTPKPTGPPVHTPAPGHFKRPPTL